MGLSPGTTGDAAHRLGLLEQQALCGCVPWGAGSSAGRNQSGGNLDTQPTPTRTGLAWSTWGEGAVCGGPEGVW